MGVIDDFFSRFGRKLLPKKPADSTSPSDDEDFASERSIAPAKSSQHQDDDKKTEKGKEENTRKNADLIQELLQTSANQSLEKKPADLHSEFQSILDRYRTRYIPEKERDHEKERGMDMER